MSSCPLCDALHITVENVFIPIRKSATHPTEKQLKILKSTCIKYNLVGKPFLTPLELDQFIQEFNKAEFPLNRRTP